MDALLHGDLATILALCKGAEDKKRLPEMQATGSQLSVVAGVRYQRYLHLARGWIPRQFSTRSHKGGVAGGRAYRSNVRL